MKAFQSQSGKKYVIDIRFNFVSKNIELKNDTFFSGDDVQLYKYSKKHNSLIGIFKPIFYFLTAVYVLVAFTQR